MTPKQFRAYLERDKHCYHCGATDDTLIPQHRAGRGIGGVKSRDTVANIIVLCAYANGKLEYDANFADYGRKAGWKLDSWQKPTEVPVWDAPNGCWWLLDATGGRQLSNQIL